MSALPEICDEASAVATLQTIFPGVNAGKFTTKLRCWGGGSATIPRRPWEARVRWAFELLMEDG